MSEFKINISTPANLEGIAATKAGLEDLLRMMGQFAANAQTAAGSSQGVAQAATNLSRAVATAGQPSLQPLAESANQTRQRLTEATTEADKFVGSLKSALAIDLAGGLIHALSEIPAKFREAIDEGVRFNATIEQMKISLAGAFRATEPDRFTSFQAAKQAGLDAIEAIRAKSNELGLDFEKLSHSFSVNLHALEVGGIHDLQKQVDVVVTLNQAMAAKGIVGNQAARDAIALLNGRANRIAFSGEVGIRNEEIKAAKEQGQLYEYLMGKLGAYKEAGQESANTFNAIQQRLRNEYQQTLGELSQPVFLALKDALLELNTAFKDEEFKKKLRGLGFDIAVLVKDGATLLRWAVELSPVLFRVAQAIGAVSLAFALLRLPGLVAMLGQKSVAWLTNARAIDTETAALARNTAAAGANVAAKMALPAAGAAGAGAAGAAGARGFMSGGTSAAFIGGSLVALEAGYLLIKKIESMEEERIEAMAAQAEAGRLVVLSMQKQIETASTVKEQEEARLKLTKEIADLNTQIGKQKKSVYVPPPDLGDASGGSAGVVGGGPTGEYQDADPDGTMLLKQRVLLLEKQLKDFDLNAGKDKTGARVAKAEHEREGKSLDEYRKSDEYKLGEARAGGNQQAIDDLTYDIEVRKVKQGLMEGEFHLSEAAAETEAQRLVSAREWNRETEKANALLDGVDKKLEKQLSSAELAAAAAAKFNEAAAKFPAAQRGSLGNAENPAAMVDAIRARLKSPLPESGADEEVKARGELAKIMVELNRLQGERNTALKSEAAETKRLGDEAKKLDDARRTHDLTLATEQAQIDILNARAKGENDIADALQRKLDLQDAITALQAKGLSLAEAEAIALAKQNAEIAEKEQRFKDEHDTFRRRPKETGNEYFERTGRIDGHAKDTDPKGGTHTGNLNDPSKDDKGTKAYDLNPNGGLSSGNLDEKGLHSVDRFGGVDPVRARLDAATGAQSALNDAPTARGALDRASNYVPTFPTGPTAGTPRPGNAPPFPGLGGPFDPLNPLAGSVLGGMTTAQYGMAPLIDRLKPPGGGGTGDGKGEVKGDNSISQAANAVKSAADGIKGAASDMKGSEGDSAKSLTQAAAAMTQAKTAMSEAATAFKDQKAKTEELTTAVEILKGQVDFLLRGN